MFSYLKPFRFGRIALFVTLAGFLCGFSQGTLANEGAKRALDVEDLYKFKMVGDPQISPEAAWVAYTVTETDPEKDASKIRIWMASSSDKEAVPMTAKDSSASLPRWSPDGKFLSFLSSRNGEKSQVWILDRRGGEAVQLTDTVQGVSSYEWSPDGSKLLLVLRDPKPEDLEKDPKKKQKPKPWVIDRLQFKVDYVGYLDRYRTHLYVFDLSDKKMTQITSGDYDDSEPVWSPNGKYIAFVSNRSDEPDANINTDIWVVSAENTDKGKTLRQVTTSSGPDQSPVWSPDGKHIAYATVIDKKYYAYFCTTHLALIPSEGGKSRILTRSLDRNIRTPKFSPDGKAVYFLLEDSGEQHLAQVNLANGEITRPVAGQRSIYSFSVGSDGSTALLISEPQLPGEVFLYKGKKLQQLSFENKDLLAELKLSEMENIHFPSKDGTEIEGFIYKPIGFRPDFRYPTILRLHGGPVGQYDVSFNYEAQLFAAHGYLVVMTNPRGSSGYGQDFSLVIYADWGNKDFEDVVAGVDYAISKGYADPEKLGVGGWSYGGILTNYVITKSKRFKGAITGASVSLYVANYGHDQYQNWYESELGLPWESRETWERISPFNSVTNVVTPTLIVGGEKDWNCPILNSEQLYQCLRRLGVTTQLVVYPNEHHGIRRPSFRKDLYERYLAWYDKYVKGVPSD
ncbi:MAG: S9 family peptidase [Candidatus Aminicenantes bacterium]|nr:S9 family peptidase [Candidatus Aminicenantes bacterium]